MNTGPRGGRLKALLLGLGVVALLEGGLRLVPILAPPPFTLELARVDDRSLHAINPAYARRFFAGVAGDVPLRGIRMTPRPYIEPAPETALRVLFAGGSTVQGYPHPKRLSAVSYLQEMLRDLHPERQIEVINAGITAASSFAVARTVEDGVSALSVDLVVVYTGHNEFYGVYGAASLDQGGGSLWSKRVHYALMHLRLTRLVSGVLTAVRGGGSEPAALVEVMGRAGAVGAHDPARQRAAANLEGNLRDLADFCRRRGVPLVLCTLASNERGFAPARGEPPLENPDRTRYQDLLEAGSRQHSAAAALEALQQARLLWDDDAYLHFLRGHHLESLGDGVAARTAYQQARDLDPRPWRAVADLNGVVRRVAGETGAMLARVDESFGTHSPTAGVGWELMADHVHPTTAGQLLLARAVISAMAQASEPWGTAPVGQLRTDGQYRRHLGDLPAERLAVVRNMAALFGAPPMDRGNESRKSELDRQAEILWAQLSDPERRGIGSWLQGEGHDLMPLNVAEALFAARDYRRAREYYGAARLEEPYTVWGDLWATLRWTRCAQLTGLPLGPMEQAALHRVLDRLPFLTQAPDFSPGLQAFITGYAHHLLGERVEALAALETAVEDGDIRRHYFREVLVMLVAELVQADRTSDAERYVVEIAEEQQQQGFGRVLVERIRATAVR